MAEFDSKQEKELELDDLLISNNDIEEVKESGGGKKIILLGAIGILLFAVVILVVYMLQGDSKEPVASAPEVNKPLENVGMPPATTDTAQSTDFGQEPISSTTDDQFQKIIDQIKAQQQEGQNSTTQELPTPPKSVPQEQQQQPKVTAPAQPTQPKTAEVTPQKPKTAGSTFDTIKANEPAAQGGEATKGFYVQVGSFSKFSPNKKLMGLIEEGKFSYRMQKSGDNNRLLIGPYATKQDAQRDLSNIRATINKDAFIKEVK